MKNGPGSASSPVGLWDSWHMQSIEANEEQWRGSQEGLASKPACPLLTSSHVQRNITQDHTRLACHKASANVESTAVRGCYDIIMFSYGYCPDFTENPTTFLILLLIKISPHNIFFYLSKTGMHPHSLCLSLGFDRGVSHLFWIRQHFLCLSKWLSELGMFFSQSLFARQTWQCNSSSLVGFRLEKAAVVVFCFRHVRRKRGRKKKHHRWTISSFLDLVRGTEDAEAW